MKKSFKAVPDSKKVTEELPLVAAVDAEELESQGVEEVEAAPLQCENCGCVLMDLSRLEPKGDDYEFTCEFCLTRNSAPASRVKPLLERPVESLEPSSPDKPKDQRDLFFVLERIKKGKEEADEVVGKKAAPSGESFVACIDVSGSMAGGKLEAVKHSLVQTIRDLKVNAENTRFALVTFESAVEAYVTPNDPFAVPEGDDVYSKRRLLKLAKKILKKVGPPKEVKEFGDAWVKRVSGLRDLGTTALGPAAVISLELAKAAAGTGGKVFLLTDGLANVGVGRVEGASERNARAFYEELGKDARSAGVVFDVVGVQVTGGGNALALNVVGLLSDLTGGEMFFISPEDVERAFGSATTRRYVARETVMRVFTPREIALAGVTGTWVEEEVTGKPGQPLHLGSLTPDREVFLKFKFVGGKAPKRGQRVPFQVQVEYVDANGDRKVRVARHEVEVTGDEEEYKRQLDYSLVANATLQEASQDYAKNAADEARAKVRALKGKLEAIAGAGVPSPALTESIGLLEDEEKEWDAAEEEIQATGVADAKSFRAARMQTLYRMGSKGRAKRRKK